MLKVGLFEPITITQHFFQHITNRHVVMGEEGYKTLNIGQKVREIVLAIEKLGGGENRYNFNEKKVLEFEA
ncbi:MAG: hypothetical protein LBH38_01095 [Holosporales bacterium]|nr:hypothetical protein [Holosporales bacterium]